MVLVTIVASAMVGALISNEVGNEATNVVATPAIIPAKTIGVSCFRYPSFKPNKSPQRKNKEEKFFRNAAVIMNQMDLIELKYNLNANSDQRSAKFEKTKNLRS